MLSFVTSVLCQEIGWEKRLSLSKMTYFVLSGT